MQLAYKSTFRDNTKKDTVLHGNIIIAVIIMIEKKNLTEIFKIVKINQE